MSKTYNKLPSEFLHIEDGYTAYCFDEACAFIISKIEDGEVPSFVVRYSKFSDFYKNLNVK